MTIEINSPKLTASVATYGAFAIRKSDGFIWNDVAGEWQESPSNSDAFIALTDRGGVNAGLYQGGNSGNMGDAGRVEITMHDSANAYALVAGTGAGTITVMSGDEVQTALVGSAMTLAADAVNAAALATDAVGEILDAADTIETGLTLRGVLRLIGAALVGKLSGAGSSTETFRNPVADSKDRITATVDAAGNRTAVITDTT